MRSFILAASAAAIVATGAYALDTTAAAPQPAAVAAPAQVADVRSGDYRLDKAHAKIVWSTSHFGFSTYYGEFTDFDARLRLDGDNPEASRLTVNVATASVDTHDEALDAHLNGADFFDAANFPSATFVSTAVRLTGPNQAEVTGNFTLRGQTRPLTLAVTFNKAGDNMAGTYTAGFSATGTIRRSDFGVSYGLPLVGDEVQLTISGEFNLV
ncbi:YceI family protein [Sphingosinicella terrae]|uniref:YceI family protein n=1 Tax=Sphingosinicella terrae TaxID=2172047 RepID=UPI000E0D4AD2|nr:YceI family protein [Sphingosinicella terrae]